MSFMSGSAAPKGRREFVFAARPSRPVAQEYEALRSDRFERKGLSRKNRKIPEDVVVSYRGAEAENTQQPAVSLDHIRFDDIRSFHNLEAYPCAFENDLDVMHWICALAAESPSARILLKEAQIEQWAIRLENLSHSGYAIDDDGHCIILDHFGFTAHALGRSVYFRNALFVHFVKALRQLWHEREARAVEKKYRPDAILMLERARAADCDVMAILSGWELRGAGHTDIWRSILGSEEGDMAMIFTRAIEKDPAGFYDGSVLTRTFCQWYGDEARVAMTDHATLERMDEWLEDAQGASVFGTDMLSRQIIEDLSRLPGGRAYLEGMGDNVRTDPYFVSMNDTVNESHLFQIVYDSNVVMVEGVPFRDRKLARLIFPGGLVKAEERR